MKKNFYAHPTAVLDEGCKVGAGSKIWHFCHLMPGCEIGEDCIIGQNVFVATGVTVGNRVKIQNNVSLYAGIHCESDVFIGPSAVFTNVINPRSFVERKTEYRPTIIQRGASIGANATIVCGVQIGIYSFIGAGAVVTRDVPDFALVYGNPARSKGWISRYGSKLVFDEKGLSTCSESGERYRFSQGKVELLSPIE